MFFTKREAVYGVLQLLLIVWAAWGVSHGIVKLIEGFKLVNQGVIFEGLLFFAATHVAYKIMKWAKPRAENEN